MNLNIKLYDSELNNVSETQELARYIVLIGTKKVNLMPGGYESYQKGLEVLSHLANGDWDNWTSEKHTISYSLNTPAEWGISPGIEEVLVLEKGKWTLNGVEAPAPRQEYHNLVNCVLKGETLMIKVPRNKGLAHVRECLATLALGEGKVIEARDEKITAAQVRKELYKITKPFIENGKADEVDGLATPSPKLMVTNLEGMRIDMFDAPSGQFGVYYMGEHNYSIPWDPSDLIAVEAWKSLSTPGCLFRVGPAK
jgi:hypothetical protein